MPLDQSAKKHFDFLLPRNRELFSPKAVAAIIGRSRNFVRKAFENQKIMGHVANSSAKRDEEKRQSYLIHRDYLLIYLPQTACHPLNNFKDQLFEVDDLKDHIQNKIKGEELELVYAW